MKLYFSAVLYIFLILISTSRTVSATQIIVDPAYVNTMYWQVMIQEATATSDMPPSLLAAIVYVESGGDPYAVSSAGAVGLAQIMPRETGFSERPTAAELRDPKLNLRWAVLIYEWFYEVCGGWLPGVLATYAGAADRQCNPTDLGWWYIKEVGLAQAKFIYLDRWWLWHPA
jgi:soluble lytic murein transglycosylase-like protein|tara:strand:- start:3511 stop:4026 length:516 start_codon:yes stop_codon:yes gene_type:complete